MKRRTAVLAAILAVTLSVLGLSPAQAVVPDAPTVTALDSSTPGHVTGTVTSDQPFVLVRLSSGAPWVPLTLASSTANFDLETWGFGANETVHAVACPTDTFDAEACSAEQTAGVGFSATDVAPDVTWFTDSTVGPGEDAEVTVSDPTGGGTLQAVWNNTDGDDQTTTLDRNGNTNLTLVDGTGTVRVERCSTDDPAVCTGFTPPVQHILTVRTSASATVGAIAPITTASPNTSATVDTDRAGTYTLAWHLEQGGNPVVGHDGTDSGSLDGSGAAEPFTIPGGGLDDGDYDVEGTITVTDPDFGEFPAAAFSGTVSVDSTGAPQVTGVNDDTAGHVTGTVSSLRPYVFVWFDGSVAKTMSTLVDGSATFDLPTWGYSGSQTLNAIACPTTTVDETCSAAQTAPFTVTDVAPDVTFFTDSTVGPGQDAIVTVNSDAGGGTLRAVWTNTEGADPVTVLTVGVGTALTLVDGTGIVSIQRCSTVNTLMCTGFTPAITSPLTVRTTATASLGTLAAINTPHPTSSGVVTTNRAGTYTLAWHLEQNGNEVPGTDGTASGALTSGVTPAFTIPAPPSDGTFSVVGTITVTDPSFGVFPAAGFTGTLAVDRVGPAVTSVSSSRTAIWPLVNSAKYPGSTVLTVTGSLVDVAGLQLRRGTTTINLTLAAGQITWYGRPSGASTGALAPAGTYTARAVDAAGNASTQSAVVVLSAQKMILKTLRRTTTPRATKVDQYVGRCSTLRRPSLRGWVGSFGYYANTKCARQTFRASGVSTAHAVFLPKAERYVDIRVEAYGGAARSKPSSRAVIRYLNTGGNWVNEKTVSRTLGTHRGVTRSTTGVVFGDRSFAWGFLTGFGNRYDVKNFTLVLRYYVLG